MKRVRTKGSANVRTWGENLSIKNLSIRSTFRLILEFRKWSIYACALSDAVNAQLVITV